MALGTTVYGTHDASTSAMSERWFLYQESHAFRISGNSNPSQEHSILWDTELTLVLRASGTLGPTVFPGFGSRSLGNPGTNMGMGDTDRE